MTGPLAGIRIIELAGIGPAPFACMMLADHGAEVIRIERPGAKKGGPGGDPAKDILLRSRKTIAIDLKSAEGIGVVRDLVASADGFVEGFRPGVTERLGLGPEVLIETTPRLVYGRMTGWGQDGPYAQAAGHDINYIALAGALHAFGRAGEKPTPPINMVGDFGGGAMMLAFGMVSALLHARTTGQGQVIDCAMTDGAALLMSMIWSFHGQGLWRDERGVNLLDSGAHFYDTYACADGKYVSIGAIEPQFYAVLREKAGLAADAEFDRQMDPRCWPALKDRLTAVFASRTRDEWCAIIEHTDACFAPVLSLAEAPAHPYNVARGTFTEVGGVVQPMPAPRYSATPTAAPHMAGGRTDTDALLDGLGYAADTITALKAGGIVA
ncbi:CaiB/BaiF CoA-transferase family protein [Sphingomonas albertensis]|uniref:CoA transferase n=1 Tax=Sphingomonas albertensis TaxID=2762591 RepID=A0ABR7AMN9_9SPHN|nr:CaiB/BaiF CoA-transferase family protein [Sphingomonas albertensis]MBC3941724.1 CoA transferase [Sphingomonas albertensis]